MPLQVAPCPRCRGAVVFGERQCRACGQTFDYGAAAPPLPSVAQMQEALIAVGVLPQPPAQPQPAHPQPAQPAMQPPVRPAAQPAPPRISHAAPGAAQMAELDTGRFESPGQVTVEEVPGFVESSLFRAFTPRDVQTEAVPGLEQTGQAEVGDVPVSTVPDVDVVVSVGEVRSAPLQDIFHSDFMKAPDGVATTMLEGIDASPSATVDRARSSAQSTRRERDARKADGALPKVVCRCGETHRLPRCPSCGTAHPGDG